MASIAATYYFELRLWDEPPGTVNAMSHNHSVSPHSGKQMHADPQHVHKHHLSIQNTPNRHFEQELKFIFIVQVKILTQN